MNTQLDKQISNMNSATGGPLLSVGKTLRQARELLGLSVNDVSNRIKFAPRQIEALEEDDFVRLPEATFVRGFLRSYARLLELDAHSLLASLPASYVQTSTLLEKKSVDIPLQTDFSPRRYNIILLSAGFTIALTVAIFMRLHESESEATKSEATKSETVAAVQTLELPNVPTGSETAQTAESTLMTAPEIPVHHADAAAPPRSVSPPAATSPEPPKRVSSAPTPAPAQQTARLVTPVTQAPAVTPKVVVTAPVPPIIAVPPTVTASVSPREGALESGAEHSLRFEFDEDAWIEIKDGNDKVLTSKMYTAKSLLRITGSSPLILVIGNAHAVRLFDGGKKVNLDRHITADVARIKLK